jgi:hypothetical protein
LSINSKKLFKKKLFGFSSSLFLRQKKKKKKKKKRKRKQEVQMSGRRQLGALPKSKSMFNLSNEDQDLQALSTPAPASRPLGGFPSTDRLSSLLTELREPARPSPKPLAKRESSEALPSPTGAPAAAGRTLSSLTSLPSLAGPNLAPSPPTTRPPRLSGGRASFGRPSSPLSSPDTSSPSSSSQPPQSHQPQQPRPNPHRKSITLSTGGGSFPAHFWVVRAGGGLVTEVEGGLGDRARVLAVREWFRREAEGGSSAETVVGAAAKVVGELVAQMTREMAERGELLGSAWNSAMRAVAERFEAGLDEQMARKEIAALQEELARVQNRTAGSDAISLAMKCTEYEDEILDLRRKVSQLERAASSSSAHPNQPSSTFSSSSSSSQLVVAVLEKEKASLIDEVIALRGMLRQIEAFGILAGDGIADEATLAAVRRSMARNSVEEAQEARQNIVWKPTPRDKINQWREEVDKLDDFFANRVRHAKDLQDLQEGIKARDQEIESLRQRVKHLFDERAHKEHQRQWMPSRATQCDWSFLASEAAAAAASASSSSESDSDGGEDESALDRIRKAELRRHRALSESQKGSPAVVAVDPSATATTTKRSSSVKRQGIPATFPASIRRLLHASSLGSTEVSVDPYKRFTRTLFVILEDKVAADAVDDRELNSRQALSQFTYDHYMMAFGLEQLAERNLAVFVDSLLAFTDFVGAHDFLSFLEAEDGSARSRELLDFYLAVLGALIDCPTGAMYVTAEGKFCVTLNRCFAAARTVFFSDSAIARADEAFKARLTRTPGVPAGGKYIHTVAGQQGNPAQQSLVDLFEMLHLCLDCLAEEREALRREAVGGPSGAAIPALVFSQIIRSRLPNLGDRKAQAMLSSARVFQAAANGNQELPEHVSEVSAEALVRILEVFGYSTYFVPRTAEAVGLRDAGTTISGTDTPTKPPPSRGQDKARERTIRFQL